MDVHLHKVKQLVLVSLELSLLILRGLMLLSQHAFLVYEFTFLIIKLRFIAIYDVLFLPILERLEIVESLEELGIVCSKGIYNSLAAD